MSAPLDQLRTEVLNLSADERRSLIHDLVDSLSEQTDPSVEKAWDDEIARRIREVEEGKVKCIPFEEAMAKVDAECK